MLYSMTAFARVQHQGEENHLICEMRSVNHRYLEINLHVPEAFRLLEMPIRELIRQFIKRGKIECMIRFQSSAKALSSLSINEALAKELCLASEKIAEFLKNPAEINPSDILHFQGVLISPEADAKKNQDEIFHIINLAIKELLFARAREGEELKQLFLQRMDLIQIELAKVRERLPKIIQDQHERLRNRLAEAKLELDSGRVEQEIVVFAQKVDVAEEIDRIEMHITEVRRVLLQEEPAGRRLDFLLQELNREANTLGSKSVDTVLTHAAVEMKVLIEQVREQVQNIE